MRYVHAIKIVSVVGLLSTCMLLAMSLLVPSVQAAVAAPVVELTVESPESAARGDAFLVTASVPSPMAKMTFEWLGKQHVVPTVMVKNATEGRAYARMLLPVPLDAAGNSQPLIVKANGAQAVRTQVALVDKARPVQTLTVDKKFTSPPAREKARIAEDRRRVAEAVSRYTLTQEWSLPLLRPVAGSISSQFGLRRVYNGATKSTHRGLDMRSPMGTPVPAVADGEVVLADGLYYSGNAVYIDHGLGVVTSYMHMSELLVQPGQKVKRGEIIGKVGSTGQSTGPHLHLGLMVLATAVDPVPFMQPAPLQ